ncbi:ATP-dependent DNA ligase [Candidatus Woesearchaeota archaeon]|nr:ATP-dependent DNA ligase [Candidatus Woesearchaeota archaeon]
MAVKFSQMADVYQKLECITSGNQIRALLSDFFKTVPLAEIDIVSYLTLGQIASKYEDINLGMAEKMVLKAVANATEQPANRVNKLFRKLGDAGIVAEQLVGKRQRELSAREVFDTLHSIARTAGAGSQERKISYLSRLFTAASPLEARYLARIVIGQLRLGAGEKAILDSLALAYTGSKTAKTMLEHAYNVCPDIGIIAKTLVNKGLKGVSKINVQVFRPVQMMLAQRVDKISEIHRKMPGLMSAEEKYDGERIQAHAKGNTIILYSRRLDNITSQFPDVVAALRASIKAKDYIIEGEVVAVDKKGNLLPFQTLMARRRKYDVEAYARKVPVHLYVFDALLVNGRNYLRTAYPERRRTLERITKEGMIVKLARRKLCEKIDDVETFFNQVIQRGCEGIIAKSCAPGAYYTPGTRGWLWIKWKREYQKELADTFDLVVVGAFAGKGRRSGTYGALLCAAYNPETDTFETFCKLGTGFNDKELAQLPRKFPAIKQQPKNVSVSRLLKPDYWVAPATVIEVLGAEITKSPLHTAAGGLALRFPRFVRYRPDKRPEQATTTKEVIKMAVRVYTELR